VEPALRKHRLDFGYSVAADASGNVLLTGHFSGTVNFGGSNLNQRGRGRMFLSPGTGAVGVHQWSQRFGSAGEDEGRTVAADMSGNVIVIGNFEGTVDLGGGSMSSAGQRDVSSPSTTPPACTSGAGDWEVRASTLPLAQWTHRGMWSVAGSFLGTVDFGGGNLTSAGFTDIFLAMYSPAGSATSGVGATVEPVPSLRVQWPWKLPGQLLSPVEFDGTVDLAAANLTSAGYNDIFIAKFSPSGTHQWSQRFGDTGYDCLNSVAADAAGNAIFTGYFAGTVTSGVAAWSALAGPTTSSSPSSGTIPPSRTYCPLPTSATTRGGR